jgi:hypothetical protein
VENFGVEQCRHSSYPFRVELRGEPGAGQILEGERRLPAGLSFRLVASKLQPPPPRPGIVARRALVDRLLTSPSAPIICVVAPPGYGKTTVLAQWSERKGPRVAWVSVDHRDNDAMVLLTYLAGALDRVEPIDPSLFRTLAGPRGLGPGYRGAPVPVRGRSDDRASCLVLDHVEALENQDCLDAVAELAVGLPTGWQLAGCPGGGCSRCCSWSCSGS